MSSDTTAEEKRLDASLHRNEHWKRWGPYLSDRAWGTVREDYSATATLGNICRTIMRARRHTDGTKTASRGICDRHQKICFAIALWNGRDPILKERLFGLTGQRG